MGFGPGDRWTETILAEDARLRDRSMESLAAGLDGEQLLDACNQLDPFWRRTDNLYHRVRAMLMLSAIYRYHLPPLLSQRPGAAIAYQSFDHLLHRRFVEAIDGMLSVQSAQGPSQALSSGLAKAYYQLAIQTLADQVRRSVRSVQGNQWMFRIGHPSDHPLRLDGRLLRTGAESGQFPMLVEKTPVRMDFSHSGWSDIFFLGMDYPEGAQVINASIDLGIHPRDEAPRPPVEAYLRVIDRPVLRLVSVDLGAEAEMEQIDELFDFAKDHLGLLKAAVIASGLVPPVMEGCHQPIERLLERVLGRRGLGLELVSSVNDIPKGSRLAVSTNLLGAMIAVLMRATGQTESLEGGLVERDRRQIAARAILGEWLGGSGGGWQDSGGVWPGIKWIRGCLAEPGDPEFGVSRGRLLPQHTVLDSQIVPPEARRRLQESLVLVHGGMAQNVGPILEMVTEKYLLRCSREWSARQEAISILQQMVEALKEGDLRRLGALTTRNFEGPLQQIIPWCTNLFTDTLIARCREEYRDQFWGFWMLGGMSGGGMGFLFDPAIKPQAQVWLQREMVEVKRRIEQQLPFAIDPVVYDFAINDRGSWATLAEGHDALLPIGYYALMAPKWIRQEVRGRSELTQRELQQLGNRMKEGQISGEWLLERLLPQANVSHVALEPLQDLLRLHGFDRQQHEQIRAALLAGRIGIAQNRMPQGTPIENVQLPDRRQMPRKRRQEQGALGAAAIRAGRVAVVTLAAGVGSRWTGGAGVVKGLHPFCRIAGRHRTFLEVHLAKSRRTARQFANPIPHLITTGYLTHQPIATAMAASGNHGYPGPVLLSPGRAVGLRMVPTERDLRFFWNELPQQLLDEQKQKVLESARESLCQWASQMGEGSDYTDNLPFQCMHPVGHWYEIPNMLRNGTLAQLLQERPQLTTLLLHNIDTLGASVDPELLGEHLESKACLTFEVIPRRLEDRGGGLARVHGRMRLLEGLAMPDERLEFELSYYNSMTTWIDIDKLLRLFELDRSALGDTARVDQAVRNTAQRMPTYVTLKDVKRRWGKGQEDIFPVLQFEKLWGDMTMLPDLDCHFIEVDIRRGQQLKDPAQLDGWVRDGSCDYVDSLCDW
jgi:galactokinase/mevalonate kinase-like predicted kinase